MQDINVAIVDDDRNWIKSITAFINREEDIFVGGIATNKDDAVSLVSSNPFDVILMDIMLGKESYGGILAAAEIHQFSRSKIIMLAVLMKEDVIIDSFKAGAVDYILKADYTNIPSIIRSAYNGPTPTEILKNEFSKLYRNDQLNVLTPAEKTVYELLEKGYTKSHIEKTLYKTNNTVKSQIKKILKKLGVKNSQEAVKKIKTNGLFHKR